MFTSHVERRISAAHHNGPPGNKCENNHGHDWFIEVEFNYDTWNLNQYGWGPEFSSIKSVIDRYDHGVHGDLNEMMGGLPPSAENFAQVLCRDITAETGYRPAVVRVHESAGNWVEYQP